MNLFEITMLSITIFFVGLIILGKNQEAKTENKARLNREARQKQEAEHAEKDRLRLKFKRNLNKIK